MRSFLWRWWPFKSTTRKIVLVIARYLALLKSLSDQKKVLYHLLFQNLWTATLTVTMLQVSAKYSTYLACTSWRKSSNFRKLPNQIGRMTNTRRNNIFRMFFQLIFPRIVKPICILEPNLNIGKLFAITHYSSFQCPLNCITRLAWHCRAANLSLL